jgi:hypothetical protein
MIENTRTVQQEQEDGAVLNIPKKTSYSLLYCNQAVFRRAIKNGDVKRLANNKLGGALQDDEILKAIKVFEDWKVEDYDIKDCEIFFDEDESSGLASPAAQQSDKDSASGASGTPAVVTLPESSPLRFWNRDVAARAAKFGEEESSNEEERNAKKKSKKAPRKKQRENADAKKKRKKRRAASASSNTSESGSSSDGSSSSDSSYGGGPPCVRQKDLKSLEDVKFFLKEVKEYAAKKGSWSRFAKKQKRFLRKEIYRADVDSFAAFYGMINSRYLSAMCDEEAQLIQRLIAFKPEDGALLREIVANFEGMVKSLEDSNSAMDTAVYSTLLCSKLNLRIADLMLHAGQQKGIKAICAAIPATRGSEQFSSTTAEEAFYGNSKGQQGGGKSGFKPMCRDFLNGRCWRKDCKYFHPKNVRGAKGGENGKGGGKTSGAFFPSGKKGGFGKPVYYGGEENANSPEQEKQNDQGRTQHNQQRQNVMNDNNTSFFTGISTVGSAEKFDLDSYYCTAARSGGDMDFGWVVFNEEIPVFLATGSNANVVLDPGCAKYSVCGETFVQNYPGQKKVMPCDLRTFVFGATKYAATKVALLDGIPFCVVEGSIPPLLSKGELVAAKAHWDFGKNTLFFERTKARLGLNTMDSGHSTVDLQKYAAAKSS